MNHEEKYGYWLLLADYDLETIDVLIEGRRWVYVVSLCQQAVERQIKGMYVYCCNTEAPKTHNVNFLFSKVAGQLEPSTPEARRFKEGRNDCEDFLVDVMYYYMSDYPFSYKNISSRFVEREVALELYEKTKSQIAWLRSFLPVPVEVSVGQH